MAIVYRKAPAFMGKTLNLHVGGGDKRIEDDFESSSPNLARFVGMGFLVRVDTEEEAKAKKKVEAARKKASDDAAKKATASKKKAAAKADGNGGKGKATKKKD